MSALDAAGDEIPLPPTEPPQPASVDVAAAVAGVEHVAIGATQPAATAPPYGYPPFAPYAGAPMPGYPAGYMMPQAYPPMYGGYMPQYPYYPYAAPTGGVAQPPVGPAPVAQQPAQPPRQAPARPEPEEEPEEEEDDDEDDPTIDRGQPSKGSNVLPFWGNEKTMNLNSLLLTNIQQSPYFKVNLYQLKTYHEVIDEIYYQVKHLEPWERGSRKVSGQTGMCGSVRGVGAGGIVSTPFCILFKLSTLKLTRKQLVGLLRHTDSPFIRAIGFLYIRYTQPPSSFWSWFEPYLDDAEPIEVKAGVTITIGELVRQLITKLDWYSTLFPRMPIPVQKQLEKKMQEYERSRKRPAKGGKKPSNERLELAEDGELSENDDGGRKSRSDERSRDRSRERGRHARSRSRNRSPERTRHRSRSRSRERRDRHRDREQESRGRRRSRSRSRSRDRHHRHAEHNGRKRVR